MRLVIIPTNEPLFGVWSSPLCHVWQHNANVQFNRFIPFRHTWHMSIFSCLAPSHAHTNVVAVSMLHSACRGLKLSDSSLRTNENIPNQNGSCMTCTTPHRVHRPPCCPKVWMRGIYTSMHLAGRAGKYPNIGLQHARTSCRHMRYVAVMRVHVSKIYRTSFGLQDRNGKHAGVLAWRS